MKFLGYGSWNSFYNAINKAMTTCSTLKIPIFDNFLQISAEIEGKPVTDFKLSRFACYLVVMNADSKKKQVAEAQVYFANLAGAVQNYLAEAENVDRLNIRSDISDKEKVYQELFIKLELSILDFSKMLVIEVCIINT